jgi:hypothetical protein
VKRRGPVCRADGRIRSTWTPWPALGVAAACASSPLSRTYEAVRLSAPS